MKKIFLLLTVFSMVFTSCDPLEDIYTDVDANSSAVVGDVIYTLTDEDYEELDLSYGSFNSEEDAKAALPDFLLNKYPVWGKGSSALIEYQLYIGNAPGVSDYTNASTYEFTNSDYATTGSDAFGFYPNVNEIDQIPAILSAQVENPTEGQIVLAKYKKYIETPVVGLANIVEYNFAGSMEGWTVVEESGTGDVWTSNSGYVQGNGFQIGANVEWLVSPSIDLTAEGNLKFQIAHAQKYYSDQSLLKILVSTDYTDDITTATWDEITLATSPGVDTYDLSENYDFSAYDGENINIAFKYESTDTDAGRWRIESLALKVLGATGETSRKGAFYMYSSGEWEAVEGVYFVSSADFDSMGEASGQPGRYDNFGSSTPPGDYLPTFLNIKYPYALEGDALTVIYDYFSSSSGAQVRGDLYTKNAGAWSGFETTISTSLQLAHDGTSWVPDNTIKYELVAADYDLIADTYRDVPEYAAAVTNLESYGNISTFNWEPEQIDAAINTVITKNFPGMEEGQKFAITVYVYDGSSHNIVINYILDGGVYVRN